jgi:hypothetical protein
MHLDKSEVCLRRQKPKLSQALLSLPYPTPEDQLLYKIRNLDNWATLV